MTTTRTSMITRIFAEMVRSSRRTGSIRRAPLKGGAELVVLVADGRITLTIKRQNQPLGERELRTFRRDCGVPDDAEVLTPPDQATRYVGVGLHRETVHYVSYRWKDDEDD